MSEPAVLHPPTLASPSLIFGRDAITRRTTLVTVRGGPPGCPKVASEHANQCMNMSSGNAPHIGQKSETLRSRRAGDAREPPFW